jgi:hypothetical protein
VNKETSKILGKDDVLGDVGIATQGFNQQTSQNSLTITKTDVTNNTSSSSFTNSTKIEPTNTTSLTNDTLKRQTTNEGKDKNKKKNTSRTPFQRPFWMSISRRPFQNSGLIKPKAEHISFPDDSLLVKSMRKPHVYVFPNFKISHSGTNNGVYWQQFYRRNE